MMTNEQLSLFRIGAVVQLKSGGPEMTVANAGPGAFGSGKTVRCRWFDGTKQMSGDFPLDCLKAAKPDLAPKSFRESMQDS
jgi:uncharacterized protein YodC (DUF2158 family)